MEKQVHPALLSISGTHGKTMSGLMLQHVLEKAKISGKFKESFPLRDSLPWLLRRSTRERARWLGLETSIEGLKKGLYKKALFDISILTNLFPQDQEDLPPEKYLSLYKSFFSTLPEKGAIIVNADDPLALEVTDVTVAQTVTYALRYPKAMVTAEDYKPHPMGSSFNVVVHSELPVITGGVHPECSFRVRLPLPGEVGVYTALAAATAALTLGASTDEVAQGLKTFSGVSRRLDFLYNNAYSIIDDISPGPYALRALFESFLPLRFRRIILVYCLQKGKSPLHMAQELLRQEGNHPLTEIFLTSSGEYMPPSSQGSWEEEQTFIKAWLEGDGRASLSIFRELAPTLDEALLSLKKGDLLLLLGGEGMNAAAGLLNLFLSKGSPTADGIIQPKQEEENKQWGFLNPT